MLAQPAVKTQTFYFTNKCCGLLKHISHFKMMGFISVVRKY
jgi:hypothetical protein